MSMLKRGSKGKDVSEIQTRLEEVGFSPGKIDGDFGRATEIAVINFKKARAFWQTELSVQRPLMFYLREKTSECSQRLS